jgi:hypothetical protein
VHHDDGLATSWMRRLQSRSLLDATTANDTATIVTVDTFQLLIEALNAGFQDIEIVDHLDATAFPLIEAIINGLPYKHQLPAQTSKTRSIRVRFNHDHVSLHIHIKRNKCVGCATSMHEVVWSTCTPDNLQQSVL